MADRKPIRWAVPRGAESYMGLAQHFLTHEENMRQSFSQPSRRARRTLPDGTCIDYIMNDVVDCIMISRPQIRARGLGKEMVWDKLPPFEEGTSNIDLSAMTVDPDVSGGYYCTVSVINGTDENGKTLSAEFSINASHTGWSIYQGVRRDDGTYEADGTNATLRLYEPLLDGTCDIIADDGRTKLKKTVNAFKSFFYYLGEDGLYYTVNSTTGALDYLTAGKSVEDVSVSPFSLYGEQHEVRHDIITEWNRHVYAIWAKSLIYIEGEGEFIAIDIDYYDVTTMISTENPNVPDTPTPLHYQLRRYTIPIIRWDLPENDAIREHEYPYVEELQNYDFGSPIITTEGGGALPSFLVMQQPMFNGDGVHTIAMKKPDEEIYFVVSYHDNDPTNKTIHWFINSTSYASYAFSTDLNVGDVDMLLDNVYYGSGI